MFRRKRTSSEAINTPTQADAEQPAERNTHRLHFTGTCSEDELHARCAEQPFWYHSFHFENSFYQPGVYDIGVDIAEYGFPADLHEMSVLDVGTGSGWFATYFEQQGADVTTVDIRGVCDLDTIGRPGYPDITSEKTAPDMITPDGQPIYYSGMSRGFWIMKEILGLNAEYVNARVYDLSPDLFGGKKFDLVFLGSLLMHLRDPIGALMAAHSVCKHQLIANAIRYEGLPEQPVQLFAGAAARGGKITWWAPNQACFKEWFLAAGFSRVDDLTLLHLTTDRLVESPKGHAPATDQVHYLVHAYVEAK